MNIRGKIEDGRSRVSCINGIDPSDYDHYIITSGECASKAEALEAFWKDYERVPEGGDIIWRRPPIYMDAGVVHTIKCRFSIRGGK